MTAPEERETANPAPETRRQGRIPADTFSNRLILSRALAGHLSIREACELTGLNRGSWQGWERGLRPRDIVETAQRVAEAMDIDRDWLLFGGPLAGPRGVPTRKSPRATSGYPGMPIRPRDNRPVGRALVGVGAGRDTGQRPTQPQRPEPRRPRRIK
jgi:transcriptional regulator with XRE-family HTH domain